MRRWLRLQLWLGRNLLAMVGSLFGLVLAFLFLSPIFFQVTESLEILTPQRQRKWFDTLERVHWWSIQVLICCWVFAFGSSIASFLNVVAYRLPRGRSILGRSSCPQCCQRLSIWENMPIFGWLRNGGRCRTCRLPISPRYLWVEVILGSIFLILFFIDVGTNQTIRALQNNGTELTAEAFRDLRTFAIHVALASLLFLVALLLLEIRAIGSPSENNEVAEKLNEKLSFKETVDGITLTESDQATLRSDPE